MEAFLKKYNIFFLILILALAVFFRFYQLKIIPPGLYPDEAMNGNNDLEALHTNTFKVFYPENNGREGLFINLQALSVKFFGNEPWALRLVSAILGTLTVLGLYFLTKELFQKETIALLASFFLAVTFWHVNFSRIGLRVIMAPFFLVWGCWLVWKLLGSSASKWKRSFLALFAGFIFGLGFHSYISYRVAPLLLVVPGWILIKRKKFFLIFIFLIGALLAASPLLIYFYHHPQDFLGRSTEISIFAAKSPVLEFLKNVALTIGMFFVYGDGNWRHNISGNPELWWPVAILFLIGIIISIKKKKSNYFFILLWLAVMLLPEMISDEGIPHALRGLVAVPAAMIFAALGFDWLVEKIKIKVRDWPGRLKKELIILAFVFLLSVAVIGFKFYFLDWAGNPNVAPSFNASYTDLGNYLKYSSSGVEKYVILNTENEKVDFMPMAVMPVMFLTDTYLPAQQKEKNISYVLPKDFGNFILKARSESNFQIFLLQPDPLLLRKLSENIPGLFTYQSNGLIIQQK